MIILRTTFAATCLLGLAHVCLGQAVQLPTFQQFGISTTVSVPDRGSVSLGGVNRSASGSNQFGGLPGNRSSGAATSASGVYISAQIHDFEAMDRALLDQAAAMRGGRAPESAARLASGKQSSSAPSIADIKRQKAAQAPAASAPDLMRQAEVALRAGNRGAARVYYQMAARRATGELRAEAIAQYHVLSSEHASANVAKR